MLVWATFFIFCLYLSSHARQQETHDNRLIWLSNELENSLMSPRIIARRLADQPSLVMSLEHGDDGTCRSIFTSVAVTAEIDYIYLLDSAGTVIAANDSETGIDLTGNGQ